MYHLDMFLHSKRGQRSRRFFPIVGILLLLIVCSLLPESTSGVQASHAVAAAYTVSGTAFNDYNQNGIQENTASIIEPGINGLVVTAYNAAGSVVTSATTSTISNVLGLYSLAIPAGTGPVRIQFSNFGATSSIADLTGMQASNHVGGTSVQFVSGVSATNTINLGLERPSEYCQSQPKLATNCYVLGNQATAGQHVVVSFPSNATGTTPAPSPLADSTAVGTTWGLAYRRSSDSLFASAYLKRHSDFKPGGSTGAIYLISGANTATPGAPTVFVDLNATAPTGLNPHNAANYNVDAGPYDLIGKMSLGGMALSDDETTLYVMNLNDNKLYSIAVGTPPAAPVAGAINSTAVPVPVGCLSTDFRPFAVTSYHGLIYVGAVCSAESTVSVALPMGNPAQLRAYVLVYTPGSGFAATPIFQTPLNYSRHCANGAQNPGTCAASGMSNINVGYPAAWNPWHTGYLGYHAVGSSATVYPQPMFSTIAFDNGNLLLGLRDRFGDQSGYQGTYAPDGTTPLYGATAGDLLRACLNTPGSFSSGWTLENNATCGGITTAGATNSRLGPGGGQYYYQYYISPYHDNTATGSIVQLPGAPSMISTVMDPNASYNTGGIRAASNTTGAQTNAYEVYGSSSALFGKSNGLGDLVAFCQSAPIEIGNRVWADTNANGIQDAGEASIVGATVHLYAANGTTLLQTTTTDATGAYAFTISSYTSYVVKLDNAVDYASGGVLYKYRLTSANQDSSTHLIDSKATLPAPASPIGTGNYPTVAVGSHTPGQNDQSFDVGLIPPPDVASAKAVALNQGNLGSIATASASSSLESGGWSITKVNDGLPTSTAPSMGWSSNLFTAVNHTEWVQLNFGASYPIQVINLYPRNDGVNVGYGFPIDFTIATSLDGTTWTTLVSKAGYAKPPGVQMFTFATQTAQYVRVTGTSLRSNPNDSNFYRMQFAEITVY